MKALFILHILFFSIPTFSDDKLLIEDTVIKKVEGDERDTIHFKNHAGVYSVHKYSTDYLKIKNNLEKSLKSKSIIKVKADATTLEINETLTP